jgi:hypothetical protein
MFESARLKVERAKEHIIELDRGLREFFQACPVRLISEPNTDDCGSRLRAVTEKELPNWVPISVGDVVHNLRSSLEHAASDLYVLANGGSEDARKRSKFPMHQTRENLIDTVDKGEIKAAFPKVAEAIVNKIQPFEAGEKLIWALGQLWNIDKHRLPIVAMSAAQIANFSAVDELGTKFIGCTATFGLGGYCNFGETQSTITITDSGQASFTVFFNEVGLLEREPLIPTLVQMAQLTNNAIGVIEEALQE